jgi:hypothetical protein
MKYFVSSRSRFAEISIVSCIWFANIFQQYGLAFELNHLQGEVVVNAAITAVT